MSGTRLNALGSSPSKTQQWFRNYAKDLTSSYESSALIEHKVTKGESREYQIFDILDKVLPTRISVKRGVVIVDSQDAESPKFDGVLFDRSLWPLLFQDNDKVVIMLESVVAAFEVKSSLGKNELQDIFSKAQKLRSMKCMSAGSFFSPPLVTAFAYKCLNRNLAFFDFAVRSQESPDSTPSLICVLNQALFGLARSDGTPLLLVDQPSAGRIPVMFQTQDTLLIYIYLLSRWAAPESKTIGTFMKYSEKVFSSLVAFHFDSDFLCRVTSSPSALDKARTCFKGNSSKSINDAYAIARGQIGLG